MYCSFDATKNKHDYYRGKYCMKNFCKDLKKRASEIFNHESVNNTINKQGE